MRSLKLTSLLVVLPVFLSACAEQENGDPPGGFEKQPVMVQEVTLAREQTYTEAVGTARALKSVDLRPEVAGEVEAVNFTPGQWVEAEQVLVQLDDEDQRLAVELAEVQLREAQTTLNRYQHSVKSGGITDSELDLAQNAVDRARIAMNRAGVELENRQVVAPFSGYVGLTDIDPGAWVSNDTVITTLDDRSQLVIRFDLPELLFGTLQPGTEIELSTWSNRVDKVQGQVVSMASRINEGERNFRLEARVDNEQDQLRPGMSFRIEARLPGNRYPKVSELALEWGGNSSYVWALEDGRAKRVPVTLIERRKGSVLVDGDLSEGTYLVTEGIQRMREGAKVRPLNLEMETAESETEPTP